MNIIEDTKSKLKEIEFKLKILECKLMLLRLPCKQFASIINLLKQHIKNYENESKTSGNPIGYYQYPSGDPCLRAPYGGPRAGEPNNFIIDQLASKEVDDKSNNYVAPQEMPMGKDGPYIPTGMSAGTNAVEIIKKIIENSKVNEK